MLINIKEIELTFIIIFNCSVCSILHCFKITKLQLHYRFNYKYIKICGIQASIEMTYLDN